MNDDYYTDASGNFKEKKGGGAKLRDSRLLTAPIGYRWKRI